MKFLLKVAVLFVIISSFRGETHAHANNGSSFIRMHDKANIKCNQQLKQISNLWGDLNKLRNSVKNSTIDPDLTLNKDPVPKFQSNTLKYFVELGHANDEIELAVSIYNRKEITCVSKDSQELLTISNLATKYELIQKKTDNFTQDFYTVLESVGRDRSILKDWIQSAHSLSGQLEKVENIGDIKLWKGQIAVSLRDKNFTASKEDLMEPKFFEIMSVFETLKNQTSFGQKNSKKHLLHFLSKENTELLGKTIPAMIGKTRQIEKYCQHMVKELNDVEVLIRGWKVRILRLDAEFLSKLEALQLKSLKFEEDRKNCLIADYQALNGGKSGGKYLKRLEFMMRDEF